MHANDRYPNELSSKVASTILIHLLKISTYHHPSDNRSNNIPVANRCVGRRHDRQIPEGRRRGWVEGAITSGHPSVLHLPLTTFRANKSWFLFPPRILGSSPHHPQPSLSVSRPSISPLYLFTCLPPHQTSLSLSISVQRLVPVDTRNLRFLRW